MAHVDLPNGLQPSLLDRLTEIDNRGTRGYSVEQMQEAVRRDLEDLFDTRQSHPDLADDFVETMNSIVTFGLPDFVSIDAITDPQKDAIGPMLEEIILRFEPRLIDIEVKMLSKPDVSATRTVSFRIKGKLRLDPAPDVAYEMVHDIAARKFTVKPAGA